MSNLDFGDSPIADTPVVSSDDLTCEVCGTPLSYAGRGRKPTRCAEHKKSGSATSGSARKRGKVSDADLNAACQNLDMLYNGLVIPITLASPRAADAWLNQIPPLNARNQMLLANNPDLVKRINAMGERGGNGAFILSHVIAITPILVIILADVRAGVAERQAADMDREGYVDAPLFADPADPDAVFRR